MFVQKNFLLIVLALAVVFAFAMKATIFQQEPSAVKASSAPTTSSQFASYWFTGKAELNHYELEQAQYGSLNPGEAVMIFVTEDFRTDTQVKAETPASRDKSIPVSRQTCRKSS